MKSSTIECHGEGYVYYRDTNIPIEGIEIQVRTDVDWQWEMAFKTLILMKH